MLFLYNREKRRKLWLARLLFFLFILLQSCSFRERVESNISEQRAQLEEYKETFTLSKGTASISWNEARASLIENNPNLIRARRRRDEVINRRKRYWKEYIPGIQGSASFIQRLNELDSIDLSAINLTAFLTLRVPNPLRITGEVQALILSEFVALREYEIQERRAVIRLYQHFLRHESLVRQLRDFSQPAENSKETFRSISNEIQNSIQSARRKKNVEEQVESNRRLISSMLDTPQTRWEPVVTSLPKLGYRNTSRSLEKDEQYGRIAVELLAASLETARLRVLRSKLALLPNFNISASSPQIFSSVDGADGVDLESINLFSGISDTLSLTNNTRENIRFSKEDYAFAIKDARADLLNDLRTLKESQDRLQRLREDLSILEKSREATAKLIKNSPRVDNIVEKVDELRDIDKDIEDLKLQLSLIELEFWLWDERKWKRTY